MTLSNLSKYSLIGLHVILFSSCYSYRIFPKEHRHLEKLENPIKAYIINPELEKEVSILGASEIFQITNDSSASTHIRLYPLEQSWVCGQPLTASLLSLGQVPVLLPDRYSFRFDEIKGGKMYHRDIELTVAQRVWFWDMFVFRKDFEEKAGKVLYGNYLKINTNL